LKLAQYICFFQIPRPRGPGEDAVVTELKNDLFLRACKRLPVERTPIWVMRQAGRYLPEYRAVRKKADFLTMCETPELAAEVTLQPVDLIGVDAAIIFSDILVVPQAMGMHLEMHEGRGPVFPQPVRTEAGVQALRPVDPVTDLRYVLDAISLVKQELKGRVPLIGFSGSPWTLLSYMVEGQGSKTFSEVKRFIFGNPGMAHQMLGKISDAVTDYLNAQIEAGVDAVQLFDTWGGILTPEDYRTFSLDYMERILSRLKRKDTPVIVFSKGVHTSYEALADCGADVVGLDWNVNIGDVRQKIGNRVALQGNMDPTVLYAGPDRIEEEAEKVLKSFGAGNGHVFNLGHGILPDVPPENLKTLVKYVQRESGKYH
jgi:uroporphyrinogen decarboxylase